MVHLDETQHGSLPQSDEESLATSSGLTMYEKKSLLVNKEFNRMGMGRYQWYLFGLCGLGYFLDLMFAHAFGLIASSLQQEFGFGDEQLGNLFTAFSVGLCIGAFTWGVLVDVIGRWWSFNITVLLASVFGIMLGLASSYNITIILTSFIGLGIGGNIPIDTTIVLEFLPQDHRFLLAALSIFQPLGVLVTTLIAFAVIPANSCATGLKSCRLVTDGVACCSRADNTGWRNLMFIIGGITITVFILRFFVFSFQESPKYLLAQNQDDSAIKVLQYVCKFNRQECRLSLRQLQALSSPPRDGEEVENADYTDSDSEPEEDERDDLQRRLIPLPPSSAQRIIKTHLSIFSLSRLNSFFSTPRMIRLTILVWIIYATQFFGFTLAGAFLPTILRRKSAKFGESLDKTYLHYLLIYSPGISATLLASYLITLPRLGKKYTMLISSFFMSISLFMFATIETPAANVGFTALEYFFQSVFNAVLYGWTAEAFPAPIRGTAAGLASFWGRLFGILAPVVGGHLLNVDGGNGVLFLAGSAVLVCTVAVGLLPVERVEMESL